MVDSECVGTFEIDPRPDEDEIRVHIEGLDGKAIEDERFKSIYDVVKGACNPGVQPCLFAHDMRSITFAISVYEDDCERWAQVMRRLPDQLRGCGLLPLRDR